MVSLQTILISFFQNIWNSFKTIFLIILMATGINYDSLLNMTSVWWSVWKAHNLIC